ncbi:uncharacterized protein LOC144732346 [Lampetra planeri]
MNHQRAERPKRNRIQKQRDYNNGIPWWEERYVQRALHLSLKDHRASKKPSASPAVTDIGGSCADDDGIGGALDVKLSRAAVLQRQDVFSHADSEETVDRARPVGALAAVTWPRMQAQRKFAQIYPPGCPGSPTSPAGSVGLAGRCVDAFERSSPLPFGFGQQQQPPFLLGPCPRSYPGSVRAPYPGAVQGRMRDLCKKTPKTEDFLTYLCLRGSSALPSSLRYYGMTPESSRPRRETQGNVATRPSKGPSPEKIVPVAVLPTQPPPPPPPPPPPTPPPTPSPKKPPRSPPSRNAIPLLVDIKKELIWPEEGILGEKRRSARKKGSAEPGGGGGGGGSDTGPTAEPPRPERARRVAASGSGAWNGGGEHQRGPDWRGDTGWNGHGPEEGDGDAGRGDVSHAEEVPAVASRDAGYRPAAKMSASKSAVPAQYPQTSQGPAQRESRGSRRSARHASRHAAALNALAAGSPAGAPEAAAAADDGGVSRGRSRATRRRLRSLEPDSDPGPPREMMRRRHALPVESPRTREELRNGLARLHRCHGGGGSDTDAEEANGTRMTRRQRAAEVRGRASGDSAKAGAVLNQQQQQKKRPQQSALPDKKRKLEEMANSVFQVEGKRQPAPPRQKTGVVSPPRASPREAVQSAITVGLAGEFNPSSGGNEEDREKSAEPSVTSEAPTDDPAAGRENDRKTRRRRRSASVERAVSTASDGDGESSRACAAPPDPAQSQPSADSAKHDDEQRGTRGPPPVAPSAIVLPACARPAQRPRRACSAPDADPGRQQQQQPPPTLRSHGKRLRSNSNLASGDETETNERPAAPWAAPAPTPVSPTLASASASAAPSFLAQALPEVPVLYPTAREFLDPLAYVEGIRSRAEVEETGACRVAPPTCWRPECRLSDDMRFVTRVQHVHKLGRRWGPNEMRLACIRKHLLRQGIALEELPLIGGCELDLASLSVLMESLGGMQQLRDARAWQRLADALRVPRAAQDRLARLQEAYCRYLLAFEGLPDGERRGLEREVLAERERIEARGGALEGQQGQGDIPEGLGLGASFKPWNRLTSRVRNGVSSNGMSPLPSDGEDGEGVTNPPKETHRDSGVLKDVHKWCFKGKSVSLTAFYRAARNLLSTHCSKEPSASLIEQKYWEIVQNQDMHVSVHCGKVDTNFVSSGFPIGRSEPFSRHSWNLTMLPSNPGSVLRHLGALSGVTVPWLNVGMVFSTWVWARDPHYLPSIDYLHTGADKIWYCIPASQKDKLEKVVHSLLQANGKSGLEMLQNSMVSPEVLSHAGVSVYRTVQRSGQFVVTFPGSFTSSVSCGYSVSETITFAPADWLPLGCRAAEEVKRRCIPNMFPMDKLLYLTAVGELEKGNAAALAHVGPLLGQLRDRELNLRRRLHVRGLRSWARYGCQDAHHPGVAEVRKRPRKWLPIESAERRCLTCRQLCYLSMVSEESENVVFCLHCALARMEEQGSCRRLKLMYRYDQEQMDSLVDRVNAAIALSLGAGLASPGTHRSPVPSVSSTAATTATTPPPPRRTANSTRRHPASEPASPTNATAPADTAATVATADAAATAGSAYDGADGRLSSPSRRRRGAEPRGGEATAAAAAEDGAYGRQGQRQVRRAALGPYGARQRGEASGPARPRP